MLASILAPAIISDPQFEPIRVTPPPSRFSMMTSIPGNESILLDKLGNEVGVAQRVARAQNLQARILWIDGTANLSRVSTEAQVVDLVKKIKSVGFNTIVFDVKPIVGFTLYPSKYAPKIEEWRGNTLPKDFDPLKYMARECKAEGIPLYVSLNSFSEGHRLTKTGLGYENLGWQTVLYEPIPFLDMPGGRYRLEPVVNESPKNDSTIGVFTDRRQVPIETAQFGVILGRDGVVISTFSRASMLAEVPAIPDGGSLLTGFGRAAEYLRVNLPHGTLAKIDSEAAWVPISERPDQQIPLMVNPNNREVQERMLLIVRELLETYDVNGIVFDDRLRYGGLNADFSYRSQALFERYVGKTLNWPEDIFKFTLSPSLSRGVRVGPYYDAWLTWRAMTLRNWVALVRKTMKEIQPDAQFGVYAGSNYAEYPRFGANYASTSFDAGFWFLTNEYKQTGFANLLDFLIPGCYYPTATIADALANGTQVGHTVEGAAQLSNRAARDQTWTYAGVMLMQFQNRPQDLPRALQAACAASQGVMVFDLSHDMERFWPIFSNTFRNRTNPPHTVSGLLNRVRLERAERDRRGIKDPPVIIHSGLPGTGM